MSRPVAGVKTVIFLASALATGFLLVVLSCALFYNWLPLIVVLTYLLAPLPNLICSRCADASDDLYSDSGSNGVRDTGYFLTSFLVVSGFGLPIALARSSIIQPVAGYLSVTGGILVYATIVTYTHFFFPAEDTFNI